MMFGAFAGAVTGRGQSGTESTAIRLIRPLKSGGAGSADSAAAAQADETRGPLPMSASRADPTVHRQRGGRPRFARGGGDFV